VKVDEHDRLARCLGYLDGFEVEIPECLDPVGVPPLTSS
jgi:hypothetical protein